MRMPIEFETRANGAVPFWFWNGDQQEDEITRQLELAREGGFKGLTIHARRGNQTEYMSERWLALMRHACEEARRLALDIWLYDEEGFPSGTVGHRLQKDAPCYQQKLLCYAYMQAAQLGKVDDVLAVFDAATYESLPLGSCAGELAAGAAGIHGLAPEATGSGREVLVFWVAHLAKYVDTLKRETVERFMEMTHRPYYEALKDYFGKPITHIYTDDLNSYLDRGASLPWTEALPELFEERMGYSLVDRLPALVENVSGCESVRLDFRTLVLDRFLNEFVDPMYRWCDAHGVVFTGHLSGDEGSIEKSVQRFGSAMAFYAREHVPGIDDFLCAVSSGCYLDALRNAQGHCPVILFKQASSVANQLKGGACSCEVLTFLGWGASMSGQSAFLNYELTLGVNLMVHHAFSYATGSVAKRDCPPSYFFQQPYWPQYRRFHDAVARSTQLLTRGVYDADTLVIHPMSSCWIAMDGRCCSIGHPFETRTEATRPTPEALEESLAAVSHELLKLRVGFEYGDEWLLAEHGTVQDARLQVGAMAYRTVVLPEVSNLLESTIALLEAFQSAGGRLIALNPSADCRVDGERTERAVFGERLTAETVTTPEALGDCGLTPSLELRTGERHAPVICHTRVVGDVREHFVHNVSDRPQAVAWGGGLQAYDPVGDVGVLTPSPELVLPPFHAVHLLPELPEDVAVRPLAETLFAGAADCSCNPDPLRPATQGPSGVQEVETPSDAWLIVPDQPNLMLIDWCELPDGSVVYHTDCNAVGSAEICVVVDIPEPGRVTALVGETVTLETMRINGQPLPPPSRKHPSSQDLDVVDVVGLVRSGANRFTFQRLVGDVLFEPFYLMGEFGVALIETDHGMRPALASLKPAFGDLVESGLPFYWGGVHYETEIVGPCVAEWLDCGEVDGVVTLTVNGAEVGCRYMAPYRFWIADHLIDGPNRIELTLHNTAQNLYGPHRRDYGVALHPCPRRGAGNGDYFLARFGLRGAASLRARGHL
jgi:hypothetical protein